MSTFKVTGKFHSHTVASKPRRDGNGEVLMGDLLVTIDNSWTNREGEKVSQEDTVPFSVFGKAAESAKFMLVGQEVEVSFVIQGNPYGGRVYPKIRAISVRAASKTERPAEPAKKAPPPPVEDSYPQDKDFDIPF